ncbi:MAG: tRNA 2-selenouridine(34) synthase MnmH [Bacillota bacterium]
MNGELTIKEVMELADPVFIDLRSPLEYRKGTIPGAVNIPLFDDQEREIIGTVYKRDRKEARNRGVAFVSPKLPQIFAAIEEQGRKGIPVLFCWRGGQRSKVLYDLLRSLEIEAYRLEGGYKAYRRYVLDRLDTSIMQKPVYVLNGLTGVGKTVVLQLLEEMGCPVMDLEGLAGHRGSLFGHLGITEQRTQKDFDALLLKRLDELDEADYLLVEGEGKRIGPVYVPDFFFKAMQEGKHILLTAPLEVRVQRILATYSPRSEEDLQQVQEAIFSLEKYVGFKTVQLYQQLLNEGNYHELVSRLCSHYYDRLYDDANPQKRSFDLVVDSSDPGQAAKAIRQFILTQQCAGVKQ